MITLMSKLAKFRLWRELEEIDVFWRGVRPLANKLVDDIIGIDLMEIDTFRGTSHPQVSLMIERILTLSCGEESI